MRIGFHSNQLGLRGTEVALYDYALGNRDILGNDSIIISSRNGDLSTLEKFQREFTVLLYDDFSEVETFVTENNIDAVYFIKAGHNDGKLVSNAKNLVHSVFNINDPHGDKYAYVSEWLGEIHNSPFVPHIVNPEMDVTVDYRKTLGIPEHAKVFGRYGGRDQFDIDFVRNTIVSSAEAGSWFLFMNTQPFVDHQRIKFVEPTYNNKLKAAFINTCDAMLHARSEGESFGLSIAEFLALNKPVITCIEGRDKNHLKMLGDKGLYYSNSYELAYFLDFWERPDFDYSTLVEKFKPKPVMKQFEEVFLK